MNKILKKKVLLGLTLFALTIPATMIANSNEAKASYVFHGVLIDDSPAHAVEDRPDSAGASTYVEANGLKYTNKSKIALNKTRKAFKSAEKKANKAKAEYKANTTAASKAKMRKLIKKANKADTHLVNVMAHTKAQKKKK